MGGLVKNRLFNGTISAGGGSCQVLMKELDRTRNRSARNVNKIRHSAEFYSLPMGNTTPLTTDNEDLATLFPCSCRVTGDLVEAWRSRIDACFTDMQNSGRFPEKKDRGLRGFYIGISAVFYAAKKAGCHEVILQKGDFLR